ncbi:hypothetical protein [Enterococcus sp. N249-2]
MNDYTKYHIAKIYSNINTYTPFELELLSQGIIKTVSDLQSVNESYQNTEEILAYTDLNQAIAYRLNDLEELSHLERDQLWL